MKHLRLLLLILGGSLHLTSQAQVRWYTPEVGKRIGVEVAPSSVPTYPLRVYQLGSSRIAALQYAVFDTVATFVQGRVIDKRTGRPVAGASIQVSYRSLGFGCCEYKAVTADKEGFFVAGWVGTSGPPGGQANRQLQVTAAGYPVVDTQQVAFGGAAYLHIELAAAQPRRP